MKTNTKETRCFFLKKKKKKRKKDRKKKTDHLEEGQVSVADVVKVNGRIRPRQVPSQTIGFRINGLRGTSVREKRRQPNHFEKKNKQTKPQEKRTNLWRETLARFVVDALVELAAKELDAQDGKDEPKDETDEQHVENGRNGKHERVDDDLQNAAARKRTKSKERLIIDPAGRCPYLHSLPSRNGT